ncbi:MAG TPA: hypothetical protein VHC90_04160, partial [Bryobacteraceae bacterium]|nr:hypothetical protein [Bryobacteraceae bacterium]
FLNRKQCKTETTCEIGNGLPQEARALNSRHMGAPEIRFVRISLRQKTRPLALYRATIRRAAPPL